MDEQIERKCDNCFFAIIEDHGYSDWTCEGSNVFCARDRHPVRNGFDRWYGEDKHLNYAKKCGIFLIGNPVHLNVEWRSDWEQRTDEELNLLRMRPDLFHFIGE